MASSFECAQWNNVKYVLGAESNIPQQSAFSFVDVHKDILKRPDTEFETKAISLLGHDWTACITAKGDDTVEVVWRLRSPVDEMASLRCCWTILEPDFTPGASCLLKQNGRYGGVLRANLSETSQYLRTSFEFQLHASNEEEFEVHEDESLACCTWRLRPRTVDGFFWSARFKAHGREWGLYLRKVLEDDIELKVVDLSVADPVLMECEAILINSSSPDLSCIQSNPDPSRQPVRFLFNLPCLRDENAENSFLQDGWLKLGLRLSFRGNVPSSLGLFDVPESPQTMVEVHTDTHIKEYVMKESSANVFDAHRGQFYLCPPHFSLKTVKQMIHTDVGSDVSESTIWFRRAGKDGMSGKVMPICRLEKFDFRLCELSEQTNPQGYHSITLYVGSNETDIQPRDPESSILLFGVFLDPKKGKLEYLGSIAPDENSNLYTICFVHLCGLQKRLKDMECAFFNVDSQNQITPIRAFQSTAKEIGLTSGSVIVVRPFVQDEPVNADRVRQELYFIHRDRPSNLLTLSDLHLDDDFGCRDAPCVICQDKPRTSGFYHEETVHICACEECARMVYERHPRRCPICMEPCTALVSKIFKA